VCAESGLHYLATAPFGLPYKRLYTWGEAPFVTKSLESSSSTEAASSLEIPQVKVLMTEQDYQYFLWIV